MSNPTVANTILQQLGGNRFCLMTGAKNFSYDDNSLYFKIGRNCYSINYVIVTLDRATDTYTMKFCYSSKNGVKERNVIEEVYCDMLQEVFTRYTGMETKMPRIVGINC